MKIRKKKPKKTINLNSTHDPIKSMLDRMVKEGFYPPLAQEVARLYAKATQWHEGGVLAELKADSSYQCFVNLSFPKGGEEYHFCVMRTEDRKICCFQRVTGEQAATYSAAQSKAMDRN